MRGKLKNRKPAVKSPAVILKCKFTLKLIENGGFTPEKDDEQIRMGVLTLVTFRNAELGQSRAQMILNVMEKII